MSDSIIDREAIRRLEDWGGPHLVTQMIRLFLENAPVRMEQMRACFEDDPGDGPMRGAHSLKSSAANVGAERVRELAQRMEDLAHEGDLDRFRALVPELEAAYAEARDALEPLTRGSSDEA